MSEFKIHKHMVDYLDQRVWKGNKIIHRGNPAFENLLFLHIPNQGGSDDEARRTEAFFQMQMGIIAGAYDFLFFWPYRGAGAYDAKDKGEGLTTAQKRFRERWERCGYPSAFGTSTEHLRDTLIGWGAKCLIHSTAPLDLRTDDQKKRDAFEMYRP